MLMNVIYLQVTEHGEHSEDRTNDSEILELEQNYSEEENYELDDSECAQEDNTIIKNEDQDPLVKVTYGIILGEVSGSSPVPTKRKIYQLDSTTNRVKLIRDENNVEHVVKVETAPKLRRIAPKPTESYDNYTIQPRDHTYHAKEHEGPRDGPVLNDKQDDEFDTFGRHVANQLRKLSTIKYIMAQEDIQSTITKFLMDDMNGQEEMGPSHVLLVQLGKHK